MPRRRGRDGEPASLVAFLAGRAVLLRPHGGDLVARGGGAVGQARRGVVMSAPSLSVDARTVVVFHARKPLPSRNGRPSPARTRPLGRLGTWYTSDLGPEVTPDEPAVESRTQGDGEATTRWQRGTPRPQARGTFFRETRFLLDAGSVQAPAVNARRISFRIASASRRARTGCGRRPIVLADDPHRTWSVPSRAFVRRSRSASSSTFFGARVNGTAGRGSSSPRPTVETTLALTSSRVTSSPRAPGRDAFFLAQEARRMAVTK